MREPSHEGEMVIGTDGEDWSLTCELDEAKPGQILVSVTEDGEFTGGLYVGPAEARAFAEALMYYADNADYWIEVD